MAITAPFTGTATIGTAEVSLISGTTTLQTNTTAGIWSACIDLAALTATETYEITVYEAAVAAGTKRIAWRRRLTGPLDEPIVHTTALVLMHGWDITMDKIAGTDRAIPYSIRQVA